MPDYKRFPLPDVGEGLVEAEILTWHVQPGQAVKVNEIFVEIETSKAAVELPAPYEGVVTELLAQPGETVAVGTPIIVFDIDPGGAPKESTSDSNGTKIASPTSASFNDSGLTAQTTYSYAVSAVNSAGESAKSTAVSEAYFARMLNLPFIAV
ncbi:biotin/lipoyl-containing protein, partial [Kibdelosporangium lantanae]